MFFQKLVFVLILSFFSFYNLSGQSLDIKSLLDSCEKVRYQFDLADSLARTAYLEAVKKDEYWGKMKANQLLGLINQVNSVQGNRDTGLYYIERAMDLSVKENDRAEIAENLSIKGLLIRDIGNVEESIKLFEESLAIYEDLNDSFNIAFTHRKIGWSYFEKGDFDKAMESYYEAKKRFEILDNQMYIADANELIGNIHFELEDLTKAKSHFDKAIKIYDSEKDSVKLLSMYNTYSQLNAVSGNYELAEETFLKMVEFGKSPKHAWINLYAFGNLGAFYIDIKKYSKGEYYCKKALELAEKSNHQFAKILALGNLAENQLGLGKLSLAQKNAIQSLKIADENGNIHAKIDVLYTLSRIYEAKQQNALALSTYKKYQILNDSIFTNENTTIINGLEEKYKAAKKDKEIALLSKNAELDALKNNRLRLGYGALLGIVGLIFYNIWQRRKEEKALFQQKQEIEIGKRKVTEFENARLHHELILKKKELTSKALLLARKNEFLISLDKQVKELKEDLNGPDKNAVDKLSRQILMDINTESDWSDFLKTFESIHPDFNKKLYQAFPEFSNNEVRMASLLKMNLSTKDIASLLNITPDAVKKTRYRMRKKMALDSDVNLTEFFMNFDLSKPLTS